MKNDVNKKDMKPVVLSGVILLLVAALVGMLLLLNFHYTTKLSELQVQNSKNLQRLTKIEVFLNDLNEQINAVRQFQQNQQQPATGDEE